MFKTDAEIIKNIIEQDSSKNIAELIEEYEEEPDLREQMSVVMDRLEEVCGIAMKEVGRVFGGSGLESEETEVKTLESIREEIWEEMLRLEDKRKDQWADIKYQTLREVLQKLGHLDEPEVLSQEWIDNHTDKFVGSFDLRFVSTKDLQNLLVPKQGDMFNGEKPDEGEVYFAIGLGGAVEINVARSIGEAIEILTEHETNYSVSIKPVIPKFVAEWIEEVKPDNSLRVAFEYIAQQKRGNYDDELAFWVEEGNSETFARAWLDGYEVEEEPKYIIDTDDIEISDGNHYLTNLTLSKDSVKLPIVGDKFDAIRFDDINQAEAIASYVGGRVEELEE